MTDIITKTDLSLIFSIISLTISVISAIVGSYAAIQVVALRNSTHSVTYMPIDPEIEKANREYAEQWATEDSEIDKQNKMWGKDLEENMPDFAPSEDDKKKFVF